MSADVRFVPQQIPIVESFGIACFRQYGGQMQVMLARRRNTYEFSEMAKVRYNNRTLPPDIFDRMTIEEKIDILSLDFSRIWYRAHMENNPLDPGYIRRKNKFERNFLFDGGKKLCARVQMSRVRNIPEIWELPKGRRALGNKRGIRESTLECAIREFEEETGVRKSQYRVYPYIRRIYSFIDSGVTYKYTYFFAIANSDTMAEISFSNIHQIKEISALQWMTLDQVRVIASGGNAAAQRLVTVLRSLFHVARRICRGCIDTRH